MDWGSRSLYIDREMPPNKYLMDWCVDSGSLKDKQRKDHFMKIPNSGSWQRFGFIRIIVKCIINLQRKYWAWRNGEGKRGRKEIEKERKVRGSNSREQKKVKKELCLAKKEIHWLKKENKRGLGKKWKIVLTLVTRKKEKRTNVHELWTI